MVALYFKICLVIASFITFIVYVYGERIQDNGWCGKNVKLDKNIFSIFCKAYILSVVPLLNIFMFIMIPISCFKKYDEGED